VNKVGTVFVEPPPPGVGVAELAASSFEHEVNPIIRMDTTINRDM
jgi:hypothetical protein